MHKNLTQTYKTNYFKLLWVVLLLSAFSAAAPTMFSTLAYVKNENMLKAANATTNFLTSELKSMTGSTSQFVRMYNEAKTQCTNPKIAPPSCKAQTVQDCERGFFHGQMIAKGTARALALSYDSKTFKCIIDSFNVKTDINDVWYFCVKDGFKKQYFTWRECYLSAEKCHKKILLVKMQKKYSLYVKMWQKNWHDYIKNSCELEKKQLRLMMSEEDLKNHWRCSVLLHWGIGSVDE